MMVNRYITALLVVLAATGMEASTYQQALRYAVTDISYEEFIQHPEAKALEEDVLCAIKAIKEASDEELSTEHHYLSAVLTGSADIMTENHHFIYYHPTTGHPYKAPLGSIVIRGPDF